MTQTTRLSQVDRDALERAISTARAESEQVRALIDRELTEDGWQHAGETAAYYLQYRSLKLRPWQSPPCTLTSDSAVSVALATPLPDHRGLRQAAGLVLELITAGLSRYEPDPVARRDRQAAQTSSVTICQHGRRHRSLLLTSK